MGNQCSASHFREQFEIVKTYHHPTLGNIKVIRSTRNKQPKLGHSYVAGDDQLIGVKTLTFNSMSFLENHLRLVKQASSYSKIPTLLRVLTYDVESKNQEGSRSIMKLNSLNTCGNEYSINIYFNHCQHTLEQVLQSKRKQIQQQNLQLPSNLKLNNYNQIDKLPFHQRKIANILYQEIQILRMIDHIIGALYFLNHLQHKHEAVSTNNIMIDEEGKFILIDALVFQIGTNYETSFADSLNKQNKLGFYYLSPELAWHLKQKHLKVRQSPQKSEVFSVGLIALNMCLLDYDIFNCDPMENRQIDSILIFDKTKMQFNKEEFSKAFKIAKTRYSEELMNLISCMLEFEPDQRINFSNLIEVLSPLLSQNLSQVQKLYTKTQQNQQASLTFEQNPISANLINKLSDLEVNYQKIMRSRTVFEQNALNSQASNVRNPEKKQINEEYILEDEKRILKQLKKISIVSKKNKNEMKEENRQIRGNQLYDLYLNEYQNIKQKRLKPDFHEF